MKTRSLAIAVAALAILFALQPSGHAVSLSNITYDKTSYNPGDSGTASVTFINDQGVLIKITSVDLTFSYFYQDGRAYSQDFTTPNLAMNVTSGATSQAITVQFSLPANIANGFFTPNVRVTYLVLNPSGFSNSQTDRSSATAPLQVASTSAQTVMYAFVATTILFAALAFYFATRFWSVKGPNRRSATN